MTNKYSILSTYNISHLQSKNIYTVISVIDQPLPQWLRTRYQELGILHRDFRVQDDALEDILHIMTDTCDAIDKSLQYDRGVLIHCGLGISRSGTVVLGYGTSITRILRFMFLANFYPVMRFMNLDREQALSFVRQKRSRVQPNTGFWEQLRIWYECHHDVFEHRGGEKFEKEAYREWKVKAVADMCDRVLTFNDVDAQPGENM